MAARELTEFARKQIGTPTAAMTRPAIAGATTADALKTDELSAIAFIRSWRPTISMTNAWRAGTSNRLMEPVANAATITIQYWAWLVALTANSTNDGIVKSDWVTSSTFRLRYRSATSPPNGPPTRTGGHGAARTRPPRRPPCVSSSASHGTATPRAQVPTATALWPGAQGRR